jgi:hypothetical protein
MNSEGGIRVRPTGTPDPRKPHGREPPGLAALHVTLDPFFRSARLPDELVRAQRRLARRFPMVLEELAAFAPFAGRWILDLGGGAGALLVRAIARFAGWGALAEFDEPSEPHRAALRAAGVEEYSRCNLTAPAVSRRSGVRSIGFSLRRSSSIFS